MKNKKKICLISSSGGHYEQLLMLKELNKKYKTFIVTEKTSYNKEDKKINYFIPQINRKELFAFIKVIIITLKSLYILIKEKPDVIISVGVLATIPMICIGKLFKKKIIYIESFAKLENPTLTGSFIYKHNLADLFLIQWKSLQKVYPKAIYKGGIY